MKEEQRYSNAQEEKLTKWKKWIWQMNHLLLNCRLYEFSRSFLMSDWSLCVIATIVNKTLTLVRFRECLFSIVR